MPQGVERNENRRKSFADGFFMRIVAHKGRQRFRMGSCGAFAARGEGAAGAHPETLSSFVRDNPHEKTVCKRFATVFVSFDALRHLRIFEPKPRFNFAALVLSLLLAAGALSNLRKSLRDKRTETKKPLSSYLEAVFPFVPAPATLSQFRAETEI